jgi:hypothetical protein
MRMRFAVVLAAAMTAAGVTGPPARADAPADFPPLGYVFEGTYSWSGACESAGSGGVPRAWPAYVCLVGAWPWDTADLYVQYDG